MSTAIQTNRHEPTPAMFAEAGAWAAKLHGPERTLKVERGFRRWLAANPAHSAAFESVTLAWEVSARLPAGRLPKLTRWQRAGYREGFVRSAAAVAAVAVLARGAVFYFQFSGVGTGVGEQRTLTLEDGTRVILNTATRVKVDYDAQMRRIRLEKGEAVFEVARQPARPFVVFAGDRRIEALGTTFVVRHEAQRVAVTLMEGKVDVRPEAIDGAAQRRILSPGERLTFVSGHVPRLDRPAVDKLTAWRAGLVNFDDTPLADAVAEMNRYSDVRLVLERPEAAGIRIEGVFRVGDVTSFAAAVARAYQLEVSEGADEILLSGIPRKAGLSALTPGAEAH